ncbi:MAG: glycoside hydrolase family 57 protein [Chloroflexi bacterium]|nr:glycoside hydrolase family 57 protein [Chloroflexota bacterium]
MSLLVACSPFETAPAPTTAPLPITPEYYPTDVPTPVPEPIYLTIIWHFHQPLYTTDPQTNLVTRPWVRINATRYYYGMAGILSKYPRVHETFNFSPLLNQQLDAFAAGTRDVYWELSNRPAGSLSDADKLFMLAHFFDETTQNTIARYPRYKELYDKRGGADETKLSAAAQSFSEQDIRDLQVWFNLATFDQDLLAAPPLKGLIDKGRDFTEDDKHTVFKALLGTIRGIGSLYKRLQDSGQAELATSPYAQPILPLLLDTNAAKDSNPSIQVPYPSFRSTQDAAEQLKRATDSYQTHYGRQPRGLLPTGGAVDQNIVQTVSASGFHWMVSGEDVLTKSLGLSAIKHDNSISDTDALYRPYNIMSTGGNPLTIFFRDSALSNLISTTYAGMDADKAADDLINRITKVKAGLVQAHAAGPRLITLVMDGDAAWRNYADDGHQFLNALYQRLTDAADRYDIQTVTPSEYLAKFPEQRSLSSLATGDWDNHGASDYSPWIGSPESNMAWTNLIRTRAFLVDYLSGAKTTDPAALSRAYTALLLAEGADWFQPAPPQLDGDAGYFDRAYRALLGQVYADVGVPLPDFLLIPILPSPVISGDRALTGLITPTIDGIVEDNEWSNAGALESAGNTQPAGNGVVSAFYYGVNTQNLYFRIDAREEWSAIASDMDSPQPLRVSIYLAKPDVASYSEFTRLGGDGDIRVALGMNATNVLEWELNTDGASSTALYAASNNGGWSGAPTVAPPGAAVGDVLEIAAPIKSLGGLPDQANLKLVVIVTRGGQVITSYPNNGVARMTMPVVTIGP